jgi:hypothetical protein
VGQHDLRHDHNMPADRDIGGQVNVREEHGPGTDRAG